MADNNTESTMKWKLDVAQFKASITDAKRQISLANAEFKQATGGAKDWADSITGVEAKIKQLSSTADNQNKILADLEGQYEAVSAEMGEASPQAQRLKVQIENQKASIAKTNTELESYNTRLDEMKAEQAQAESPMGKLNDTISEQEDKLSSLKDEYANAVIQYGKNSTEAKKLAGEISDLSGELQENKGKLDDAKGAADRFDQSLDNAGNGAEDASDGFTTLKGALADLLADGVKKVTDGLKDFAVDSSGAFAKLQAQLGLSTDEIGKYKEAVKGVYADNFGESLKDVGDKFAYIAQVTGETDPSKIAELTENAMTLEDTFGSDFNETIRGVSNLMQHFGISSEEAFDLFAKGSQNGLDYTDELGDNIAEYGGNFAEAGYSAEEYFQLLENGSKGGAYNLDKVNDSINEVKNRLGDGTIEKNLSMFSTGTQDTFQAWQDGSATMKDVIDSIVGDITNCTDQQDALTMAATAFGTMGEDANLDVVKSLTTLGDSYDDVNGSMEEMKQQRYDDVVSQIEGLGRTLQTDILAPILEQILPVVKDAINFVVDNKDTVVAALAGIAAGITALLVVDKIKKMVDAFNAWKTATEGMTIAQKLLNAAQSANPLGIIIGLIAAVVAALVTLYTTNEDFRNKVNEIWGNIKDFIGGVIDGIVVFFTETVPSAIQSLLEWFQQLPENIWNALTTAATNIANWASEIGQMALEAGQTFLQNVIQFFNDLPYNLGFLLATAILTVAQWVVNMGQEALEAGQTFLQNVVSFFQQLPSNIWNFLTSTISNVVSWVSSMGQQATQAGQSFLNNVIQFIQNLPSMIAGFLSSVISNLVSWVSNMGAKGREAASSLFNAVVNGLASLPSQIYSIGSNLVRGLWNGINDMTGWIIGKIQSFGARVMDGIKSFFGINSPSKLMRDEVGKFLPEGIAVGFEEQLPKSMRAIKGELSASVDGLKASVSGASANINGGISSGYVAGSKVGGQTVIFNQTNNSPKALSRLDIYRQTNSLIFSAKVGLANV